MIVYKKWRKQKKDAFGLREYQKCEGWFLFGFIPLYIKKEPWTIYR